MPSNQGLGAIACAVRSVLPSFRNLTDSLTGQTDDANSRQFLAKFEDEIVRFKMWVGNLGAHQAGRASLDYRLREAPHLQEQVIYLLKDMEESTRDALALVHHRPPSWRRDQYSRGHEEETSSKASSEDELDQESGAALADSDNDDMSQETGLSTLYTDVREAIDCLLRLSVAIANPVPHERIRKLGAGLSEDASYHEAHDIRHVRDKFPKIISAELAEILGKAITHRRQFFKYREAHHARLAAGLESMALHSGDAEVDTGRTDIIAKTVASSLPEHLKTPTNVDPRAGLINEDGGSDNIGISETSYATSASFATEDFSENKKKPPPLRVPPLPTTAECGSFECPFCYRMVSAHTRVAWKRHVFGDLRPYTCLFPGCVESNVDFDRRHHWQLHISQHHWRSWFCSFKCERIFSSALELRDHISSQHLSDASEEQVNALTAFSERAAPDDMTNECPLCGKALVGLQQYVKDVGAHLEQLSLFALPSLVDENSEQDCEGDERHARLIAENTSETSSKSRSPLRIETDIIEEDWAQPRTFTAGEDLLEHMSDGEGDQRFDVRATSPKSRMEEQVKKRAEDVTSEEAEPVILRPELEKANASGHGVDGQFLRLREEYIQERIDHMKTRLTQERREESAAERTTAELKDQVGEKAKRKTEEKSTEVPPIKFKDGVGRKYTFPFHICNTWQGMEELIKSAFLQVEMIGPHVQAGHYDLIGPDGEIIPPSLWEKVIQPGWSISMTIWPSDKAPLVGPSAPPPIFRGSIPPPPVGAPPPPTGFRGPLPQPRPGAIPKSWSQAGRILPALQGRGGRPPAGSNDPALGVIVDTIEASKHKEADSSSNPATNQQNQGL